MNKFRLYLTGSYEREAVVDSLHLSGKTSEQRHKRIAKLIIYLNKLRRSNIQENDAIARFAL